MALSIRFLLACLAGGRVGLKRHSKECQLFWFKLFLLTVKENRAVF